MKKSRAISFISLVALVLAAINAYAHVDTIITLDGDKLVGFPEKYQPAEFNITKNRLRIGQYSMSFDEYFQSYFEEDNYELTFLASWYGEGLPYLIIQVTPKGENYSYRMLFNLDNLEFQGTNIRIKEKKITRTFVVEQTDEFLREINSTITKVQK